MRFSIELLLQSLHGSFFVRDVKLMFFATSVVNISWDSTIWTEFKFHLVSNLNIIGMKNILVRTINESIRYFCDELFSSRTKIC